MPRSGYLATPEVHAMFMWFFQLVSLISYMIPLGVEG